MSTAQICMHFTRTAEHTKVRQCCDLHFMMVAEPNTASGAL